MQVDAANNHFQKAVSLVNHTNRSLFLTGKAGTGKTTFLKYIKEKTFKKLVVVAPTGVAAINAGGVTIHSFFQLPFGTFISGRNDGWNQVSGPVYNTNQLLGKLRIQRKKRDLIRELDLLIIDEVSMVRADVLDAIDIVLRHVRRRHHEPFGGLQMVYIGDLFQLPPVVKNEEWKWMQQTYEGPFFFHAHALKEASPIYLELKKIYRQDNPGFIKLLNHIRNNDCSREDLAELDQYYKPNFLPDKEAGFITLTSHNYLADKINQNELEKLSGKSNRLEAELEGNFPESAYPADRLLELKKGAQIMFIKNDKGEDRRYFNGKTGIVDHINRSEGKIYIKFPEEQDTLELKKETWRNIRYQYDEQKDEIKEKEIGSFRQYPVRLAWAVTIHKSQGLTFQKAIIDAGRAFAPGQVYVALSRLTSLEGLVLRSQITPASIRTDEHVLRYADNALPEEMLDHTLEEAQQKFLQQSISAAFLWNKLLDKLETYQEEADPGSAQSRLMESGWINELKGALLEQQQVGNKFIPVLEVLLQQGRPSYERMHDRTKAAVEWFTKDLNKKVIERINAQIDTLKVKPRTGKKVRLLKKLLQTFLDKQTQLSQAVVITETLLGSGEQKALMDVATEMFRPQRQPMPEEKQKKQVKGASRRISLELYKENKSTAEIATLRELKEATIVNHLVSFIPTGEIQIEELFESEKITALAVLIKENPEASSSEIHEKTGGKFSYPEIQAVQLHLKQEP